MYHTLNDFINDWNYESKCTLKVFNALQDDMLNTKVHEKVRTAGVLAWHITQSIKEMMERTGLKVEIEDHDQYPDWTVAALLENYQKASASLVSQLGANWNDATMEQVDNMYGENWKRGVTLSVLVNHQIHHRGQLEVVMRMCGLLVPGIYGPANEEWASMGMPAMQ